MIEQKQVDALLLRWFKRLVKVLLIVAVGLGVALALLLLSTPGRALVLRIVLDQTNDLIPGTIEVERLQRLGLGGVELSGVRVFDPQGTEVARIGHLRLDTNMSGLIGGTIALRRIQIDETRVDARVHEERRGLLSAFIDPDAPESPPSEGLPPNVVIDHIVVRDLTTRLPELEQFGQVDVQLARMTTSFGLVEGNYRADLGDLSLSSWRGSEKLLDLSASGRLPGDDSPTVLHLLATSGAIKLKLDGSMVSPTQAQWERRPLDVDLSVSGVSAARLADLLRDENLKDLFLGDLALDLSAHGSASDLNVDGVLETAGGQINFDQLSAHGQEFTMALSTEGLVLNKLQLGLPPRKVAAQITAKLSGLPPDPAQVEIQLRQATVDDEPLLDLDMQGTWSDRVIRGLKLRGTSGDSRVLVHGDVDAAGVSDLAAQVDLRAPLLERLSRLVGEDLSGRIQTTAQLHRSRNGNLKAEGRVVLNDVSHGVMPHEGKREAEGPESAGSELKQAQFDFSLRGIPPDLWVSLKGKLLDARFADKYVDEAQITVAGNLSDLNLSLKAEGGLSKRPSNGERAPKDRLGLALDTHLVRRGTTTTIAGSGKGEVQGQRLSFALEPTSVRDEGSIATQGIDLQIAEQRVHIEGEIQARGRSKGLSISVGPVKLQSLSALAKDEIHPVGELTCEARLDGSLELPILEFQIAGKSIGLSGKPTVDLSARGKFDTATGNAFLEADFAAKDGLLGGLVAKIEFPRGVHYATHLHEATSEISLDLKRLESRFVEPYLSPGTLPVHGRISAEVQAKGSLADPRLAAKTMLALEGERNVRLAHELNYETGLLTTSAQIIDRQGEFALIEAEASMQEERPSALQLGEALARLQSEGRWEVALNTSRRQLKDLPLVDLFADPGGLPPVEVEIVASALHHANAEPNVEIQLELQQVKGVRLADCDSEGLRVLVRAKHDGAENVVTVEGSRDGEGLLYAEAKSELRLAPVLAGEALRLGPLELSLRSRKLELASLPFVCGRANGIMEAQLKGVDLLGANPHIEAEVGIQGFSLGSRDRLNLELLAEASKGRLSSELKLRGTEHFKGSWGHLRASLPWKFKDARISIEDSAKIATQLRLEKLPVSPLFPLKGPISYVRGSLDADLKGEGGLKSPKLDGNLRLNQLAFTSTSIAQPLRDINGELRFNGRKITISGVEAHDQDGVLTLDGVIDLTDLEKVRGKIDISAEDFPLRQRGQVVAITNLEATAESTVTPDQTRAKLTLHEVDTWLESVAVRTGIDLEAHEEFVINGKAVHDSRIKKQESSAASGEAGDGVVPQGAIEEKDESRQLVIIEIDSTGKFWVKRDDFAVKLDTSLKTEIVDDTVRVNGDVRVDRGYLQLFGKVFDLKRDSVIRFIGTNPPNPVLELEAEHKARSGAVVSVRITGRGNAPELAFFIDGDAVEAGQAVQELFGGEKGGDSGDDAGSQAQSFVSGLTAGVLATAARRELGAAAPILMIDPADKAGEGRIRAGFELDDIVPSFLRPIVTGVYLEGIVARESEGQSTTTTQFGALLELYFPRNFFTAGQYGPGTTWSVDFGWQL